MTQQELVMEYVREFGFIIPAKQGGHPYRGGFFGSETSRACRYLRKAGKLISEREGKFEKFMLNEYGDSLKPTPAKFWIPPEERPKPEKVEPKEPDTMKLF